jgi:hypothetical protein
MGAIADLIRSFASGLRTLFLGEGDSRGDTDTAFAGRLRFGRQ